jgi:hypothetical protein
LFLGAVAIVVGWFFLRTRGLETTSPSVERPQALSVSGSLDVPSANESTPSRRNSPLALPTESADAASESRGNRLLCVAQLSVDARHDASLRIFVTVDKADTALVPAEQGNWQAVVFPSDESIVLGEAITLRMESAVFACRILRMPLSPSLMETGIANFSVDLRPGASLNLWMTDADNRPATDCVFWLNYRQLSESADELPPGAMSTRRGITDASGRATVLGLEPGDWVLSADAKKWWDNATPTLVTAGTGLTEHLLLPRFEASEYFSGVLRLATPVRWGCLKILMVDPDGSVYGELPCYEGGEYFAEDLSEGEMLIARVEDSCTGRRSKTFQMIGGTQSTLTDVEWE